MCQVPEKATVVLPSAVLPQTTEADPCLEKGFCFLFFCKSFKVKAQDLLQFVEMCLLLVGTAGVCSSQWSGLSTKKKVTV